MLNHHKLRSLEGLTRVELQALIGSARQFQRAAARPGAALAPLRGKNLALLSNDPDSPDASAFLRAATELGAQVARVRAGSLGEPGQRDPRDTAGLLGQLYDAIECQGLSAAELRQLDRDCDVPVFDGIASSGHPLQAIALLMALQDVQGDALRAQGPARRVAELLGLPLAGDGDPPPTSEDAVARNRHHLLQAVLSCTLV